MERGVIVRGRLHGRQIELEERIDELEGEEVEVFVRAARPKPEKPSPSRLLDVVARFPAGSRSKEEIDRELADERAEWDRHG